MNRPTVQDDAYFIFDDARCLAQGHPAGWSSIDVSDKGVKATQRLTPLLIVIIPIVKLVPGKITCGSTSVIHYVFPVVSTFQVVISRTLRGTCSWVDFGHPLTAELGFGFSCFGHFGFKVFPGPVRSLCFWSV